MPVDSFSSGELGIVGLALVVVLAALRLAHVAIEHRRRRSERPGPRSDAPPS